MTQPEYFATCSVLYAHCIGAKTARCASSFPFCVRLIYVYCCKTYYVGHYWSPALPTLLVQHERTNVLQATEFVARSHKKAAASAWQLLLDNRSFALAAAAPLRSDLHADKLRAIDATNKLNAIILGYRLHIQFCSVNTGTKLYEFSFLQRCVLLQLLYVQPQSAQSE